MSQDDSTQDETTDASTDLGPRPEPQIEPGEVNPGGVDAQPDDGDQTVPDLPPEDNPAVEDKAPASIRESLAAGEDTSTEATKKSGSDDDPDTGTETEESPA